MNTAKTFDRSEQLLIAFGLAKLMLLALFFASFALMPSVPAAAQSGDDCKGRNLLTVLEETDRSTYDQVLAEEAATENSGSIFWKVEKDGRKPSWLLGTMHLSDPQIAAIPEDVRVSVLESDRIIIESVEALDQQAMQKAMGTIAHLTLLTKGTLRDLVDDDLEDELEIAVQQRGIPMQLADRMQPWLIATTISLPVCEIQRKQQGEKVLDGVLASFAVDNGKDLAGLETVAEQLTAIASVPVDYHVSALEETLASGSLALDMIETMKVAYKQGRMGVVFPLMKALMPKSGNSEGTAKFQELLIDRRNQVMLERSLPLLENGSSFIAVGALHLPGKTGLVELLREQGYLVTSMR